MTRTKSRANLAVVHSANTRHPTIRLHSLDEIRREMASCYRAGKTGKIPTSDAARLVYILAEMVKLWHVKMIEERINNLEGKL